MEQEILKTLQEIRTAIYIIVTLVFFGIIVNSVRTAISIKGLLRRELYEQFKEEASQLYDKGDFTSLIDHCSKKLKINPNHTYALWYLAKAYYQKNDFNQAKQYFEKVAESEPGWESEHVRPYLERIEQKEVNR